MHYATGGNFPEETSALPVFFEKYLVEAVLNGGKVEVRLGEDDVLRGRVDVETALAEHVIPHGFLKLSKSPSHSSCLRTRLHLLGAPS